MVRKRSHTNGEMKPPKIDDLKLINGIGPGVEKRLNGIGIFTFAQLAALSPADVAAAVADLAGLSTERIIKQDWIGLASKLAAGEAELHVEAQTPVEPPVTIERTPAATHFVEPEQAHELTAESISDVAQEEIEVPAEPEQIVRVAIPVESPAPTEDALSAPLPVDSEVEPEKDTALSQERYHPATFTIEFLLDEDNNLLSTRVLHVQSKRMDTWRGWHPAQLVDFMSENAGLDIPSDEPVLPDAEGPDQVPVVVPDSEPRTPREADPRFIGKLNVCEMKIIGIETSSLSRALTHDEPFDVRLTLDLNELQVPDNTLLNYKASIYGKGSRSGLVTGETQGTIISADTVTIKVEGNTLPEEGIYQLAARVIVGLPTMELRVRPGTTGVIDGGQVQVF